MKEFDTKSHWEKIYSKKKAEEMSWFQPVPGLSLDLILGFELPPEAAILDVGGGDSLLVDALKPEGYDNISVLDISGTALERAKERIGRNAINIQWIESDILEFSASNAYDLWHDRATFHFLTDPDKISRYLDIAHRALRKNGILILACFSDQGPDKCSGLPVNQYSEESMTRLLTQRFERIGCHRADHKTPSGSLQNFLVCSFRKK